LRGTPIGRAIIGRTPWGRLGETSELVGTCIYLASAASGHVTGTCLPVNGGYLASDGLERG
jgi:NAD(P)-dependent dehydrogenase (short-subunit alcohol dehydrogenase family)